MESNNKKHRKIACYPDLIEVTGSLVSAILLCQLTYWWSRKSGPLLYKTDLELAGETGCGLKQIRTAKRKLIDKGFIETVNKGIPQRTHYRLIRTADDVVQKGVHPIGENSFAKTAQQFDQKGYTNSCITRKTISETTYPVSTIPSASHSGIVRVRAFLTRWQAIVDENDWELPLVWHTPDQELDNRILQALDEHGGIEGLIQHLESRCTDIALEQEWRTDDYQSKPVNLTFLLNDSMIICSLTKRSV